MQASIFQSTPLAYSYPLWTSIPWRSKQSNIFGCFSSSAAVRRCRPLPLAVRRRSAKLTYLNYPQRVPQMTRWRRASYIPQWPYLQCLQR